MPRPNSSSSVRMLREKRTVAAMVEVFCRDHHGTHGALCNSCERLLDYAVTRLDHCPFGVEKGTCARCSVHCYSPAMRLRIKEVMRYSGPRMLYRHPILALMHQWDGLRRAKDAAPADRGDGYRERKIAV
jgi:hypothetical protein